MGTKATRVFLLLSLIFLAMLRYFLWWPKIDQEQLAWYNEKEKITFLGLVVAEPDRCSDRTNLVVRAEDFTGKVLVSTNLYPEYNYGDSLEISCQLQTPGQIEDFAYDKYLALQKIYSVCYRPQIKLLAHNNGRWSYATILKIKAKTASIISSALPAPSEGLLRAILLGQKRGLSKELAAKFSLVGISHIVAISGMNISIIINVLFGFFLAVGLRRKTSFYLIVVFLIVFVIMIGFPASAVRAAIMGIIGLLAMQVGRLNNSSWSLVLTALVMLVFNPLLLFYDVGFQLSFAAIFGLMKFSDRFERFFKKIKIPVVFEIRATLVATFSAQLTTLPLIIYHFGQASLISPVVNILVLPLLLPIMIFGLAFSLVGFASLSLATVLFWLEWLLLNYVIKVAELFSAFSFSAINGLEIGPWFLSLFYAGIFLFLNKNKLICLVKRR